MHRCIVIIRRLFFQVRSSRKKREKERSARMQFPPSFSRYVILLFPRWIVSLNKRPPPRKALIIRNALRTTFMVATLVSR